MVCESYSSKATGGGGVGRRGREGGTKGGEIAVDQEEIQACFTKSAREWGCSLDNNSTNYLQLNKTNMLLHVKHFKCFKTSQHC